MKIWSVKSRYIHWSLVWLIFLIYILLTALAAVPSGTRPVTSQFVALINCLCKIPKSWFNNQYLKKMQRKEKEKRKRFKLNGKLQNWSKYLNEFRAVTRCMRAAFYWVDYQKLLMCPLIKRLGRAFVSKHVAELLKQIAKLLNHSD